VVSPIRQFRQFPVGGMSVRAGRHHVLVAERTKYVVDTAALEADQRIDVCRLLLSVTAADVATFEIDIPWAAAAEWPDEVRQAAELLSSIKEPTRGEDALYRRTGEVLKSDTPAWEAFLTFAPYAYDASTWSVHSQQIVALSDAAESMVAALTPEQVTAVADGTGWDALVALKKWRPQRG
jgi:hypothetical protein